MQQVTDKLEQIIQAYTPSLRSITEEGWSYQPAPDKWSKKEIIGHLIDSALNNIQRFIRSQYETVPHIVYDQNEWVRLQHYTRCTAADLLQLWTLLNAQIGHILKHMPAEAYQRQCNTGKAEEQLLSLEFLAQDYVRHLQHHLQQLVPGVNPALPL